MNVMNKDSSLHKASKNKSLATLVSGAFIVIVVLSLVGTALSYNRLMGFDKILGDITDNSLPSSAEANQINTVLKEVIYLTERLANTKNHASRKIALNKLTEQDALLTDLVNKFDNSIHMHNQLRTIRNEIADLNNLVIKEIEIAEQIKKKIVEAYQLQDGILAELSTLFSANKFFEVESIPVIQSVALANRATALKRLQLVRQLAREIDSHLSEMETMLLKLDNLEGDSLLPNLSQLKNVLIGKTGLINLRIEQLQITGRSRGRGNFLHNLISDTSRLAEANAHKINESIVYTAQKTAEQIAIQVKWSISLAVLIVIFLILVIYFIDRKVVGRIVKLNNSVLKRINSEDSPINIDGNDEITELARSFVYFTEKVDQQTLQLQKLSFTDALTNLPNRRAMDNRLAHDIQTAQRGKWPLSVILLDIDYFKLYNDFYGHVAGDECLKAVAEALSQIHQRDSDFVARYGGEEFAMIMPSTPKDGGILLAKRICETIEHLQLPHEKSNVSKYLTVSVGVATFDEDNITTTDNILTTTDEALYHAKQSGRNCYVHYDDCFNIEVDD